MAARDKGYFEREGLECVFSDQLTSPDGNLGGRVGAYQTFERGRNSNINCACHWTIKVAASVGHGKLYPHAYCVAPAAVFVRPESDIHHPAQLARVAISVGYQSGSHYSTIQALEQYLRPNRGSQFQKGGGGQVPGSEVLSGNRRRRRGAPVGDRRFEPKNNQFLEVSRLAGAGRFEPSYGGIRSPSGMPPNCPRRIRQFQTETQSINRAACQPAGVVPCCRRHRAETR
jgi:hypothetical protein